MKGGNLNLEKLCMYLLSYSTNHVSLAKHINPVVLSVRILWLYSKGNPNKPLQCSMPLYITQDYLGYLYVRLILEGYSGCMVSRLR